MTDFTITAGKPFQRLIHAEGVKAIWPSLDQVEVRAQLRKGAGPNYALIANLHDHMTVAYGTGPQAQDVIVDWDMTGADTADLATGNYDVVLSDPGTEDGRLIVVLEGKIRVGSLTTRPGGQS